MIRLFWTDVATVGKNPAALSLAGFLSPARREKYLRAKREEDRLLSLGAALLLDAGLRSYGLREADMEYVCGANGKPRFADPRAPRFNLSHSGSVAVAAFSDREIGCDVERIGRVSAAVAGRFFRPEECDAAERLSDPAARAKFLSGIWTMKESVMKYTGLGWELPPVRIRLDPDADPSPVTGAEAAEGCFVSRFDAIPGYCLSVCAKEQAEKPVPVFVDLSSFPEL